MVHDNETLVGLVGQLRAVIADGLSAGSWDDAREILRTAEHPRPSTATIVPILDGDLNPL